jgi:hypothetical protein
MGILYDKVMQQKKLFVIEELQKLNVTQSQDGRDLKDLEYEDLKHELVLASFRNIDAENPSYKYF